MNIRSVISKSAVEFGWNAVKGINTEYCGEFVGFEKIGAEKPARFIRVSMLLPLHVYRDST